LVSRTPAACRKLLERARRDVSAGRRLITASRAEHQRLLDAFLRAANAGDVAALTSLLASDAVLITDGGPDGRVFQGVRHPRRPPEGARQLAAFTTATPARAPLEAVRRDLNGQPALVFYQEGRPFSAVLLAVADGRIQRVFFHADPTRLRHL